MLAVCPILNSRRLAASNDHADSQRCLQEIVTGLKLFPSQPDSTVAEL
jgi:hypothetical protein